MGQDSVAEEFRSISFHAHSLFCTEALLSCLNHLQWAQNEKGIFSLEVESVSQQYQSCQTNLNISA